MDKIVLTERFHDGKVFHNNPVYFRIRDGRILESRSLKDIESGKFSFPDTVEVKDYRGMVVTPGIIDSHNHFTLTALKMRFQTDLGQATDFSGICNILQEASARSAEWVMGYNINEFNLVEKRLPTVRELDAMVSVNPLIITSSSEHYAVCNSIALSRSGVTKDTEDPFGSAIGRYDNGEPNGILYESPAMNLVKENIPEYTLDQYADALEHASREYRKCGITTVKDTGGTGNDVNEEKRVEALNRLSDSGRLRIRVGISLPVYALDDVRKMRNLSRRINESDLLRFTGFKLFLDGSGLSRTAWMKSEWSRDYLNVDSGNTGKSLWSLETFKEAVRELASVGSTVSIHAIGDRAITEAIRVVGEVKEADAAGSRFTIIHCNVPDSIDMEKMKGLGISAEVQAAFIYFVGAAFMSNFGRERGNRLFPFRTMIKNGINVCNSSDSPVTTYEPSYGIAASVTRQMKHEPDFNASYRAEERLTMEETLNTYTSNCAQCLEWNEIGTLKVGSFADMVIWRKLPEKFEEDMSSETMIRNVMLSGETY